MGLSSDSISESVVEISESPLFHYQYSSLYKGISPLSLPEKRFGLTEVTDLCLKQVKPRSRYLFQLDVTPSIRSHSHSLPNRSYVKVPNNVVPGNKPVNVGYGLSCLHLQVLSDEKWSLPLLIDRIKPSENGKQVGLCQLESILQDKSRLFAQAELLINTADSDYSHPSFVAPLYKYKNLVNIIRLRKGQKVYKQEHRTHTGGRDAYKGEKAYLLDHSQARKAGKHDYLANSIFETYEFDDFQQIHTKTSKGRLLDIELYRFNDLILETKKGHKMLDKPIDILVSKVFDAKTGRAVFAPMYTAITNQERRTISSIEAFDSYRHRYDIEPAFRFGKQKLKLDKYKTSKIENYDNWLTIYQLAYWLLFVASDEVKYQPKKWRGYKAENKPENLKEHLSPCQTFSGLQDLLLKIDPKPFKPRSSNKGKGREKGTKLTPKTRHPVLKKRKKRTKIDKKEQQNK